MVVRPRDETLPLALPAPRTETLGFELQPALPWTVPETRRREATRAAHEQDFPSLRSLVDFHLSLKSVRRERTSPRTREAYALGLRRFLAFTGGANGRRLELARIEPEDLEAWIGALQREGLAANTISSYLSGVKAAYRALAWAGAARENPALEVRAPRDPTPAHARKGALSLPVYGQLLGQPARTFNPRDPRRARDPLLLDLGGSAGLRAGELCALDVADLDVALAQVTVRFGKGGKRRVVPLTRATLALARAWLDARRVLVLRGGVSETEPALLVALDHRRAGRRLTPDGARFVAEGHYAALGLPKSLWGLHTLRRTAGTHLYRATRDLHVVADVLGHASVNTSAIYAKLDQEARAEAVQAMQALRERAATGEA
ncbi:MAG TPA: tyrosine-type recombinase/integrase [Deinococcales bacterium]|nr:tyrosine-type recombinase/integrase [Deinococcales bacterium]